MTSCVTGTSHNSPIQRTLCCLCFNNQFTNRFMSAVLHCDLFIKFGIVCKRKTKKWGYKKAHNHKPSDKERTVNRRSCCEAVDRLSEGSDRRVLQKRSATDMGCQSTKRIGHGKKKACEEAQRVNWLCANGNEEDCSVMSVRR